MPKSSRLSLSGSHRKIERADRHIQELNASLIAFFKTDFYRLQINPNAAGQDVLTFDSKPLPCDIPLVIGDAIHNLRAALDLMACEIVVKAGGTCTRYTNFPVRDTRQELVGTLNGGEIKVAGQDICDLILDVIKPYKGGNDPLWSLHQLDIIDKHRLLIPVVSVTQLSGISAHDDNNNRFEDLTFLVGEGGRLNAIATSAKLHITNYGQPAFGVFFRQGEPFENQPVVPTLHQLAQIVTGVVQAIEKAYLARS